MFLSAVKPYVTVIIIAVVVLQYAYALFCLLKLAYFDVTKKQYILWNLCILIAFFVGPTAFLVYYFKHPEQRITPADPEAPIDESAEEAEPEKTEADAQNESGQADASDGE